MSLGVEVVVIAPPDKYSSEISQKGCRYIPIEMRPASVNPFYDLALLIRFYRILKAIRPDVALPFTIKPNIYGSVAASLLGIPVINNIAGLGRSFEKAGFVNSVVKILYRFSLSKSEKIFFQNHDDRRIFENNRLVEASRTSVLPGSGINLTRFSAAPMPDKKTKTKFLFAARLLDQKGILDLIKAVELLRAKGFDLELEVAGILLSGIKGSVSAATVQKWVDDGLITYLGESRDIRKQIIMVHCVVLPSVYGEGTPRILLEAAAMGRALITTDNVGCRDVVDDGKNGFICAKSDPVDLAEKMGMMCKLPSTNLEEMGRHSREKAELMFDERIVVEAYSNAIRALPDLVD